MDSKKKKKVIIISIILSLLMLSILVGVFCIPFFISKTNDEKNLTNKYTEVQQLYDSIPEDNKTSIIHQYTGVEISGQKDILSLYSVSVNVISYDNINNVEWNETPCDIINEKSTTILYSMYLYDDKSIVNETASYRIEIPLPKDFDAERVKVFKVVDDIATPVYTTIKNSKIILYQKNLGTFAIVNDTENSDSKNFISIKGVSLKYENILSLKVYSSMLISEKPSEITILMWDKEQKRYTYENATKKGKYLNDNVFELSNIEFKDINNTIYIKLCAKTKSGYIYSPLVEYNILQYCINTYNSTSDELIRKLMLGTVAYSQISNDYIDNDVSIWDNFTLATNYKTSLQKLIHSETFDGKNLYSETGTILFYGRNVDMNNKIHYNIFLKEEVKNPEDLYLSATINDEEHKVQFEQDVTYGFYKATFKEIQPYDINTPLLHLPITLD